MGKMNKKKNKVMRKVIKEKKKGGDRMRTGGLVDSVEPIIYVGDDGEATKAFLIQFYSEKDNGEPSYPNVIVDETGTYTLVVVHCRCSSCKQSADIT